MISMDIQVWMAAIFTLMTFSFIFKHSPAFRLAEAVSVGGTAGYGLWVAYENVQRLAITPINAGMTDRWVPLIVGILYLFYLLPSKFSWVARYPTAMAVGISIGATLIPAVATYFVKPMQLTLISFWTGDILTNINHLIIYILTFCGLAFFIYSRETFTKGRFSFVSKLGRAGLMIAFGVAIGTVLNAKIGPLAEQLNYLIHTWLGL